MFSKKSFLFFGWITTVFERFYDYHVLSYIFIYEVPFFSKGKLKNILNISVWQPNITERTIANNMIFVVKYRKPLLVNSLGEDIKQIMFDINKKEDSQFSIDTMETNRDHLHILLDIQPATSAASVCSRLKQMSTHKIWEIHSEILKKDF